MKTQKRRAKISICIPNYNRANNLFEVLMDCRHQTVQPYEIIIQDDSTDGNEMLKIDHLVKGFPKVKFLRNKVNVGLAKNVNLVIKRATGEHIVIVNNDDRLSPFYIEEIGEFISKYPEFNVYTTNACAIEDSGNVRGDYRIFYQDRQIDKVNGIKYLWKKYFINLISVSGATIYKKNYLSKHPFNSEYGNESDLDNALHILATENIMYVDTPIYYVRMNSSNTSIGLRSSVERLDKYIAHCIAIYTAYSKHFKNIPLYLIKPKSIYFLQLTAKYHYGFAKTLKLLKLDNKIDMPLILISILMYIYQYLKARALFHMYKHSFKRYFPRDYS